MYKVAILGCENSHANSFLRHARAHPETYGEIEFVGVYSDDREAAGKLSAEFGVSVMERFDALVGQVDGLLITARHGRDHYRFAKPYLASGIPMFIDKPITVSEEDAVAFMKAAKASKVQVCGGSVLIHSPYVQYLKRLAERETYGKTLGGYLRAPINLVNPYGDFHFYCQHLVQSMAEIYGYEPKSVQAFDRGNVISFVVRYADYDVTAVFTEKNYLYYASLSAEKKVLGSDFDASAGFNEEFAEFLRLLHGGKGADYAEFIKPVFIQNAMERALRSGREEPVHTVEEI